MTTPRRTEHTRRQRPQRTQTTPKNEQDLKFCNRWLVHRDHLRAWEEAGYKTAYSAFRQLALAKLARFRKYLEGRLPAVEKVLARKVALDRAEILLAISRLGDVNAQDYVEPFDEVDEKTREVRQGWRLKHLCALTREQAAAIDSISAGPYGLTYTLPTVRTKLKALTTLGEQAANFKKAGEGARHLHFHMEGVPIEEIRALKHKLIGLLGPQQSRQIFGMTEEEQGQ